MTKRNRRSGASVSYPPVLDACCGSKGFWFDKNDERAVFVDCRRESVRIPDRVRKNGRPWTGWTVKVDPDHVADFTALPFPDDTFSLVVFDPPHRTTLTAANAMAAQYGILEGDWRSMLRVGFAECFRVLKPSGVLIFKWNEKDVLVREILELTPERPLFGHRSGKQNQTHWIAFLKPCSVSVPVAECG